MAARFLPGNRLTLLNSGAEYFPALIKAIDEPTVAQCLSTTATLACRKLRRYSKIRMPAVSSLL